MGTTRFDFVHERILVSGGTRGIGRELILALADARAKVAFTYRRDQEAAEQLAAAVRERGGEALPLAVDIRDPARIAEVLEHITVTWGPLTGLVNNAGIKNDQALFRMSHEAWSEVIATNLGGTFFLTQAAIGQMLRQQRGKVINLASVSGIIGVAGQANYAASKAGIIALTRCLAREVAPFNVQVNAVAPGFIDTDMVSSMPDKARAESLKQVPMRRFGRSAEVAAAVMFLLSAESSYITGSTLVIDGGLTA